MREDSFGYKPKNELIKNKKQNNENAININNFSNNLSSSIPKKFPFSLSAKPIVFMNKKIDINSNTNNNNKKQFIMNHNLPKYSHKKNNENISLLEKIKDKVYKENQKTKKNTNHKKIQIA